MIPETLQVNIIPDTSLVRIFLGNREIRLLALSDRATFGDRFISYLSTGDFQARVNTISDIEVIYMGAMDIPALIGDSMEALVVTAQNREELQEQGDDLVYGVFEGLSSLIAQKHTTFEVESMLG